MKSTELAPVYANRRRRLAEAVGEGVAVIPTAPERVRNRDSHYPYRFDSHFYYLTGFTEPEAALVLAGGKSILFCRSRNEEREIWDGLRYGPEAARDRLHWYAERFELVEVNSSFYAVPEESTVRRWVEQTPDGVESLMLVGHNPGIEELAVQLAARGQPDALAELRRKFPTGALAELREEHREVGGDVAAALAARPAHDGERLYIRLQWPEAAAPPDGPAAGYEARISMIIDDGKPIFYQVAKAASYSPAQLAEYVGRYYSEELDANYTFSIAGNKLVARKKVGDELILSPQFADVFGNSDRGISIRFSRGQDGLVTGFLLNTSRMKGVVFKKLLSAAG